MIQVTIPGIPVSVNERWRPSRHGGYYTSDDTSSWQSDVVLLVGPALAGVRNEWQHAVNAGAVVRVTLTWFRPDRRRRDTSNAIKALEDGLQGALGIDDRYFEWTTHRAYDRKNPRVDLTLELEEVER